MKVLIACECSGIVRDAFRRRGHNAMSCDLKPTEAPGPHYQGDIFDVVNGGGWDILIAHPVCTYLTCSAEWAYKDPDYERYPGVGYHMRLKPGTLFGEKRREARAEAVEFVKRLWAVPIRKKAFENPTGHLSSAWMKPAQVIQPYQFGDDASKGTCLWLDNLPPLVIDPAARCNGRKVEWPLGSGKIVERWSNQTDGGQNKLPPSEGRAAARAVTYSGIAEAMADQWGSAKPVALF